MINTKYHIAFGPLVHMKTRVF